MTLGHIHLHGVQIKVDSRTNAVYIVLHQVSGDRGTVL